MEADTRKYPRVRGEEGVHGFGSTGEAEIPPRARGREDCGDERHDESGNTPACAGKSGGWQCEAGAARKYPRVRGEECRATLSGSKAPEIPPRARGRVPGDTERV